MAKTLGVPAAQLMADASASPVLWLRRAVEVANVEAEVMPLLQERADARASARAKNRK